MLSVSSPPFSEKVGELDVVYPFSPSLEYSSHIISKPPDFICPIGTECLFVKVYTSFDLS